MESADDGSIFLETDMTEWISVKDRLPECGEWVLVFTRVKDRSLIELALLDMTIGFVNPILGYDCMKKVSHWMPLPEPPA